MNISLPSRRSKHAACFALMAAMLLVFLIGVGRAQIPVIAAPVLVADSDAIIMMKVDKVSDVAQQSINLGKEGQETKGYFRTFDGTVQSVVRDVSGKLKAGDKIHVLAMAPPPEVAGPGGGHRMMTDGPSYPRLQEGQSYRLLLNIIPGGKEYYLPSYFKCFTPADQISPNAGANVETNFDPEKWPWRKPDAAGLQMAVLLNPVPIRAHAWAAHPGGVKQTMVFVMLALRNTSDKPLRVLADPNLKPLSIELSDAASKPLGKAAGAAVDLYGSSNGNIPATAREPITLAPGQIIFIGEAGRSRWFTRLATDLDAGKYRLIVRYSIPAQAAATEPSEAAAHSPPIWSGTLEAPPVDFEVIASVPKNGPG